MTPEQLNHGFFALSDPSRRLLLERLKDGPMAVGPLAEPLKMSMPAVTKHLRVLERAGLITRSRKGQQRPCSLVEENLYILTRWLNNTFPVEEEVEDDLFTLPTNLL